MSARRGAAGLPGRARFRTTRSFEGGGEMGFRAICVGLLLACLPAAGCGTVANLARSKPDSGGRVPFGGVQRDVQCLEAVANGDPVARPHAKADQEQYPRVGLALVCAVDLPFSFVGDLVTWPYVATYTFINRPYPTPPIIQAGGDPPPQMPPPPQPPEPLPTPRKVPEKVADAK